MAFGYQALTTDVDAYKRRNARRQVMYDVPQGPTTLIGILSLPESEITDGPEYEWLEKRFVERTVTTVSFTGADGPWMNGGSGGSTDATFEANAGDTVRVRVSTNKNLGDLRVNDRIIFLRQPTNNAEIFIDVTIQVVSVASDIITAVIQNTISSGTTGTLTNTLAAAAGKVGLIEGQASAEGSTLSSMSRPTWPLSIVNYTSILRTPFTHTATALNQPLFYATEGLWENTCRDNCVDHMVNLENQMLFGERSKASVTDTDGSDTVRRTMGGIAWFLKEWEKANGGTFLYRNGEAALTALTDDKKRIWDAGSTGVFSDATWASVLERAFRRCYTSSHEKLLIGGSGLIAAINKKYKGSVVVNTQMMSEHKVGFYLHTVVTEFGTLHFKSHPRFNELAHLRYDGFVLDVQNLKLRPMKGRDTHLQPNVQANDFDGRKDAYLTELGLEVRFPESHGWIRNCQSIAA